MLKVAQDIATFSIFVILFSCSQTNEIPKLQPSASENNKFIMSTSRTFFGSKDDDLLNIRISCRDNETRLKQKCNVWSATRDGHAKIFKSNDITRSGEFSYRFENGLGDCSLSAGGTWNDCKKDRERTELVTDEFSDRKPKWFKFSIFIPLGTKCARGVSCSYWQIKTYNSHTPLYMLRWRGKQITWTDFANGEWAGPQESYIMHPDEFRGKWLDFLINVEFKNWPEKGKLRVWINGKQSLEKIGYTRPIAGDNNYMKWGIYKTFVSNAQEQRTKQIVYYDSIAIAETCDGLEIEKEGYSCGDFE